MIYESPWVSLYCDRVEFPAGRIIERHHVLDFHTGFIGAVIRNDRNEILMVHAYRYVLDSIEWEIPTGRIEKDENPLEAARRETLEESGYESRDLRLVYSYNPINGISDKAFHVVFGTAGEKTGEFDPNEIQAVKWVSVDKILTMIRNREITDGFTLTALLLYLHREA